MDEKTESLWVVGLSLAIVGSICGAVGDLVLRHTFIKSQYEKAVAEEKRHAGVELGGGHQRTAQVTARDGGIRGGGGRRDRGVDGEGGRGGFPALSAAWPQPWPESWLGGESPPQPRQLLPRQFQPRPIVREPRGAMHFGSLMISALDLLSRKQPSNNDISSRKNSTGNIFSSNLPGLSDVPEKPDEGAESPRAYAATARAPSWRLSEIDSAGCQQLTINLPTSFFERPTLEGDGTTNVEVETEPRPEPRMLQASKSVLGSNAEVVGDSSPLDPKAADDVSEVESSWKDLLCSTCALKTIGILLTSFAEDALTFAALFFAPASLIAPVLGIHIVAALVLSSIFFKERISRVGWLCAFACFVGVIGIAHSGGKETTMNSLADLRQLFASDSQEESFGKSAFVIALIFTPLMLLFLAAPLFAPALFPASSSPIQDTSQLSSPQPFATQRVANGLGAHERSLDPKDHEPRAAGRKALGRIPYMPHRHDSHFSFTSPHHHAHHHDFVDYDPRRKDRMIFEANLETPTSSADLAASVASGDSMMVANDGGSGALVSRLALAILAGVLGGITEALAKVVTVVLSDLFFGSAAGRVAVLLSPITLFVVVAFGVTTVCGVLALNLSLMMLPTAQVVPISNSFVLLTGSFSSIVLFNELPQNKLLYSIALSSVVLSTGGLFLSDEFLSRSNDSFSQTHRAAQHLSPRNLSAKNLSPNNLSSEENLLQDLERRVTSRDGDEDQDSLDSQTCSRSCFLPLHFSAPHRNPHDEHNPEDDSRKLHEGIAVHEGHESHESPEGEAKHLTSASDLLYCTSEPPRNYFTALMRSMKLNKLRTFDLCTRGTEGGDPRGSPVNRNAGVETAKEFFAVAKRPRRTHNHINKASDLTDIKDFNDIDGIDNDHEKLNSSSTLALRFDGKAKTRNRQTQTVLGTADVESNCRTLPALPPIRDPLLSSSMEADSLRYSGRRSSLEAQERPQGSRRIPIPLERKTPESSTALLHSHSHTPQSMPFSAPSDRDSSRRSNASFSTLIGSILPIRRPIASHLYFYPNHFPFRLLKFAMHPSARSDYSRHHFTSSSHTKRTGLRTRTRSQTNPPFHSSSHPHLSPHTLVADSNSNSVAHSLDGHSDVRGHIQSHIEKHTRIRCSYTGYNLGTHSHSHSHSHKYSNLGADQDVCPGREASRVGKPFGSGELSSILTSGDLEENQRMALTESSEPVRKVQTCSVANGSRQIASVGALLRGGLLVKRPAG